MYVEFDNILHVRTPVIVKYSLGSKDTVRDDHLMIIVFQKYSCQYVHFFYDHLKLVSKHGGEIRTCLQENRIRKVVNG